MEVFNIAIACFLIGSALVACLAKNHRQLIISMGILILSTAGLWFLLGAKVLSLFLVVGYGLPIFWLTQKLADKNLLFDQNGIKNTNAKRIRYLGLVIGMLITILVITTIFILKALPSQMFFQKFIINKSNISATINSNLLAIFNGFANNYIISGMIGIILVIVILIILPRASNFKK